MISETSRYKGLGYCGASDEKHRVVTGTYVFETLTSSVACSKECRGGVAVDVEEDVCKFGEP